MFIARKKDVVTSALNQHGMGFSFETLMPENFMSQC